MNGFPKGCGVDELIDSMRGSFSRLAKGLPDHWQVPLSNDLVQSVSMTEGRTDVLCRHEGPLGCLHIQRWPRQQVHDVASTADISFIDKVVAVSAITGVMVEGKIHR